MMNDRAPQAEQQMRRHSCEHREQAAVQQQPPANDICAHAASAGATIQLAMGKPAHSEQMRSLVGAVLQLAPQIKTEQFRARMGNGWTASSSSVALGEIMLLHFVGDAVEQQADLKKQRWWEYLGRVLDWVQAHTSGAVPAPLASRECIKVSTAKENLVTIDKAKLQRLGIFPEKWILPLSAAGMHGKAAAHEEEQQVEGGQQPQDVGNSPVQQRQPQAQLASEPAQRRQQSQRYSAVKAGQAVMRQIEEESDEDAAKEARDAAWPSQPPAPMLRKAASRAAAPVAEPFRAAKEPVAAPLAETVLTFKRTSVKAQSEQLRTLLTALQQLCPGARPALKDIKKLSGYARQYPAVQQLLGEGAPEVEGLAGEFAAAEYLKKLLDWARQASGGGDPAASTALKVTEVSICIDIGQLHSIGVWPDQWTFPLTAENVVATCQRHGRAPVVQQPQPTAKRKLGSLLRPTSAAASQRTTDTALALPPGKRVRGAAGKQPKGLGVSALPLQGRQEQQQATRKRLEVRRPSTAKVPQAGKRQAGRDTRGDYSGEYALTDPEDDLAPLLKLPRPTKRQQQQQQSAGRSVAALSGARHPSGSKAVGGAADRASPSTTAGQQPERRACYWLDRTGAAAQKFTRDSATWPEDVGKIISCHDCQVPHVQHLCHSSKRSDSCKPCTKSYCLQCCQHYDYLFDLEEHDPLYPLLDDYCDGACPCCLKICARRLCLRAERGDVGVLPPPPSHTPVQRRVLALHLAWCVLEASKKLLEPGEAAADRVAPAAIPIIRVPLGCRVLCNRCGTCLEDVFWHCGDQSCEADFCQICAAELRAGGEELSCPVCTSTSLALQTMLPPEMAAKLRSAGGVLRALRESGADSDLQTVVDSYDFEHRLWQMLDEEPATGAQAAATAKPAPRHENGGSRRQRGAIELPAQPSTAAGAMPAALTGATNGAGPSKPWAHYKQMLNQNEPAQQQQQQQGQGGAQVGDEDEELVIDDFVFASNRAWPLSAASPASVQGTYPPAPAAPLMPPGSSQLQQSAKALPLSSWHSDLRPEDYRLAAQRPDGVQNYLWTPHVRDFARGSPRRAETVRRFGERWGAGEPIIVRGFRGRMNWGPTIMMRAARDLKDGNKGSQEGADEEDKKHITVVDCANYGRQMAHFFPQTFFNHYQRCYGDTCARDGAKLSMLKLKDFPPENDFQTRCRRHHNDFTEMLNSCMPEYMHPTQGALNMACMLPSYTIPPDLGPKGYIAFGREEEQEGEGDSVTKLHEDLSDAINIMCHVQHRPDTPGSTTRGRPPPARCGAANAELPGYGGAGAVWDLYRREDLPLLRRFLQDVGAGKIAVCPPFRHAGQDLLGNPVVDVIHDQCFMLTAKHRKLLAELYSVHSWHVEQYEWEGVVIPAGSAHQVRNLRACIKIALDFVSPESVGECMKLRAEFRELAKKERPTQADLRAEEDVGNRHFHDKLQAANMVLVGLGKALDTLTEAAEVGA